MATGGFSCCSSCLNDGRNTVARHYCVDCEIYFCTKCLKCHNTIPSLTKHQVNDFDSPYTIDTYEDEASVSKTTTGPVNDFADMFRCTLHDGNCIDTYCKDHDKVCCGGCAVVKHRSCETVSIAVAAKDFKSSPVMKKFKEALTGNLVQCKQEKEKRTSNLDSIDKQKLELIRNVDKYEENITAKIKELANISRMEIRSKYKEHKAVLDNDIEALDIMIATAARVTDKLEHSDREQLFIIVKNSEEVPKDGEVLLQAMTNNCKKRELKFYLDENLETRVLEMKSLGSDHKEYQAEYLSSITINQKGESDAEILDICLMDSNDILVADYTNKKLKRFSSTLEFKDAILLSGTPVAVCKIDKHEVAVRSSRTVQIVSIGQTMLVTSSFTLESEGYGMTSDAGTGEIFACENNKVGVYSKKGNKLKNYDRDINGKQMFSACRQIALGENGHDIYVTDEINGLIVLNKSGTLKMKVFISGVSRPWPLCLLPGNMFLSGCVQSRVLAQIDNTGKQVGNLINTTEDKPQYTYCAVYDRKNCRLFVGRGYPGVLDVFTMTAK